MLWCFLFLVQAWLLALLGAQKDDRLALLHLGHLHHQGLHGVLSDPDVAYAYYANIAKQTTLDRHNHSTEQVKHTFVNRFLKCAGFTHLGDSLLKIIGQHITIYGTKTLQWRIFSCDILFYINDLNSCLSHMKHVSSYQIFSCILKRYTQNTTVITADMQLRGWEESLIWSTPISL